MPRSIQLKKQFINSHIFVEINDPSLLFSSLSTLASEKDSCLLLNDYTMIILAQKTRKNKFLKKLTLCPPSLNNQTRYFMISKQNRFEVKLL
jgi:hypothetical protein